MGNELAVMDSERLETMEELSRLQLQGLSEYAISRRLKMPRKVVIELLDEYRAILRNDEAARERALDALNDYDRNVSLIIKEMWETITVIDEEIGSGNRSHNLIAKRTDLLKALADVDQKRVDTIQKAGVLEGSDLGDELAKMEEQRDMVIDILRNDLCQDCRKRIGEKLSRVTQKSEVVVVYNG